MTVTAQYAQEHLPELLESAERGEEIEISREGKASAKLFIMPAQVQPAPKGERILGAGRGTFLSSLDEDWKRLKDEDANLMNNAPLVTTGEA